MMLEHVIEVEQVNIEEGSLAREHLDHLASKHALACAYQVGRRVSEDNVGEGYPRQPASKHPLSKL